MPPIMCQPGDNKVFRASKKARKETKIHDQDYLEN